MPRVLISDTEAFAPRPVAVQQEKSEDQTLKDLEKLKLGFQIAGAAAPFAGMAVSGLDKYLYSPISEKVKEHFKTGREKEYYGKGVGEQLLEEGAAAEPGAGVVAPSEKKAEAAAAAPPVVGGAVAPPAAELVQRIAQERQAASMGITTPSVLDERGRVLTPERPYTKVGQKFRPIPEMVAASRRKEKEGSSEEDKEKLANLNRKLAIVDLRNSPPKRGTGEVSVELPELEESLAGKYVEPIQQVEPYKAREVPAPPAAGAVPAGRKPFVDTVSGKVQPGYLEQMPPAKSFAAAPAGAPGEAKTVDLMEMVRGKKPAEGPKTLGNASEDELNKAKYKLQYLVDQKKADPTAAAAVAQAQSRIDLIDKELQHRSEFIPFEEWAARARAAETPAEQAEVMRQAERVGMPVSDLADLFKTRVQRGKALALGTREEPGLFPQLARPLSETEEEFKRLKIAAMAEGYNAKQAETIAKTELAKARAGRAEAQTRETEMLAGFRAGELAEKTMWLHAKHENLEKKTAAEIARLKADAARMYAVAGNMQDRRNLEWYKAHNERAKLEIANADKNVEDAERAAEQSQNSAIAAERNFQSHIQEMADLEKAAKKLDPDSPGYNSAMVRVQEMKSKVPGLRRALDMAQDQQTASNEVLKGVRSVREEAGRFADAAKQAADQFATIEREKRKIAPLPKPVPAPIKEEESGIGGAFRRILGGGGGVPAAVQAGERRTATTQDGRKVTVEKGSDGKWHEVK